VRLQSAGVANIRPRKTEKGTVDNFEPEPAEIVDGHNKKRIACVLEEDACAIERLDARQNGTVSEEWFCYRHARITSARLGSNHDADFPEDRWKRPGISLGEPHVFAASAQGQCTRSTNQRAR
jgi:hypothetical protein